MSNNDMRAEVGLKKICEENQLKLEILRKEVVDLEELLIKTRKDLKMKKYELEDFKKHHYMMLDSYNALRPHPLVRGAFATNWDGTPVNW